MELTNSFCRTDPVIARDALEQVVAEVVWIAPGRMISSDIAIPAAVDCNRVRIGQLLSNLLGKAVTHGSKTEPIVVRSRITGDQLVISVANGGRPIDEATRATLFQPFFRGSCVPLRSAWVLACTSRRRSPRRMAGRWR